jgi:hypothetical protein
LETDVADAVECKLISSVPSERFGGLKIDHEFVFGRLKNWQIGWLRAFEDLPDLGARVGDIEYVVRNCRLKELVTRAQHRCQTTFARQALVILCLQRNTLVQRACLQSVKAASGNHFCSNALSGCELST